MLSTGKIWVWCELEVHLHWMLTGFYPVPTGWADWCSVRKMATNIMGDFPSWSRKGLDLLLGPASQEHGVGPGSVLQ